MNDQGYTSFSVVLIRVLQASYILSEYLKLVEKSGSNKRMVTLAAVVTVAGIHQLTSNLVVVTLVHYQLKTITSMAAVVEAQAKAAKQAADTPGAIPLATVQEAQKVLDNLKNSAK